ncbi:MAG: Gfo/Idh/MocA family oxidoreductase [Pirellulales bacterium]
MSQRIKSNEEFTRRALLGAGAAATLTAASYARVLGANDRVGVGFIGFGLIGKRHVLDFQAEEDAALVAMAETHKGRLDEAISVMGSQARGYGDFRKLLENHDVDAVVVSTPDHWHALQTMMACAAGKDVYVEKPLTLFVREGRWMADVARRHKRVVQTGTQQRSGPHYAKARELIQSGHIGPVTSVRMSATRNIMPGYGSPPDGTPPPELDYDMWLGPAPLRPYNPNRSIYHFRWFWDYSGGQMTNLAAHSIDILDWFLGAAGPTAVSSVGGRFSLRDNGETPDTQDAIFQYPEFTAAWWHREASDAEESSTPLTFFGPKGSLSVTRQSLMVIPDVQIDPARTVPQFSGRGPQGGRAQRLAARQGRPRWTEPISDRSGDVYQQFKLHVRNFLDCVKSREQPVSDLESGHRVATACHLSNLALRLGRTVRWDAKQETALDDDKAAAMLQRPYRAPWDRELKVLVS